jgi:hypothetical protein
MLDHRAAQAPGPAIEKASGELRAPSLIKPPSAAHSCYKLWRDLLLKLCIDKNTLIGEAIHGAAMRQNTGGWYALQYSGVGRIARNLLRGSGAGILFALCAGMQACSSDPSWPALGKISDLSNILTAEQRQKAVQDLQKNDPNHDKDAAAQKLAPAQ